MPVGPVRGKSSPSRRKAGLAGSSHVSLPSEFPSARGGLADATLVARRPGLLAGLIKKDNT